MVSSLNLAFKFTGIIIDALKSDEMCYIHVQIGFYLNYL